MKKKALLLGGTGAMGIYLVPELLKQGYEVSVTSRDNKASTNKNLFYIQGNAHEMSFLEECLSEHWDVVIDFMTYSTEEFISRVDILLKNVEHYFFLSTYRVFAETKSKITEKSPRLLDVSMDKEYLLTDEYALAKARQEDILRASRFENWTILRPSITYSKNRFQLATLEANTVILRSLLNLPVPVSKLILEKNTTMTWAGDVAKMIAKLANNLEAYGTDFNVVTSEHRTWSEIADVYKKQINMKLLKVEHKEYMNLASNNPYQVNYDRMYDRVMDNSKVLEVTGIAQKDLLTPELGLALELKSINRNNHPFICDYSFQAKVDRITRTRIPLAKSGVKNKLRYIVNYYNLKG